MIGFGVYSIRLRSILLIKDASLHSAKVTNTYCRRINVEWLPSRAWMVQAHHIFECLNITSNFESYSEFHVHKAADLGLISISLYRHRRLLPSTLRTRRGSTPRLSIPLPSGRPSIRGTLCFSNPRLPCILVSRSIRSGTSERGRCPESWLSGY